MNERRTTDPLKRGLLAIALLGLLLPAAAGAAPEAWKGISPAALATVLEQDRPPLLINTMGLLECLDHGIAGSLCIPSEAFAERIGELPADRARPLVLYCESEDSHKSRAAADLAVRAGHTAVRVLEGGLPAWKGAGYPTVATERIPRRAIPSIKPPVLQKRLIQKQDLLLVDIRSEIFFKAGHIEGAVNLPMYQLHRRWRELPLNRLLILVDNRGFRSPLAASYLAARGYVVEPLFGGMKAWQAMQAKAQKKGQ